MHIILERPYYLQLPEEQQKLIELSIILYERELKLETGLVDYSFILFPMAKAYEGFIKQYLFDLNLISQKTFEGRRFRIGRALNPDIRDNQKDEFWLFDDMVGLCGPEIAHSLWDTWLECRNRVFHYFPQRNVRLTLTAVGNRLQLLDETITSAYQCKIETMDQENFVVMRDLTA